MAYEYMIEHYDIEQDITIKRDGWGLYNAYDELHRLENNPNVKDVVVKLRIKTENGVSQWVETEI